MSIVIRAEKLEKRYRIGNIPPLRRGLGRLTGRFLSSPHTFWALQNVSFSIREGQSVGIIGPNGSGKSTLLKILSRVTKPTRGTLDIKGRIGALIEVGAGFHPELTGRENVFLNGSILGMKKKELVAAFDEIVAFAEMEKFIDTPVKHYSSGMYIRLGFSIAAHIHPDIFLVDEILAVGDLMFQKKCFEWVQRYLRSGKTFLLVSHQMHHVENVCERVLYINGGQIRFDGPPELAISHYMNDSGRSAMSGGSHACSATAQVTGESGTCRVTLLDPVGLPAHVICLDDSLSIRIEYDLNFKVHHPKIEIAFNCRGDRIGQVNTVSDKTAPEFIEGKGCIIFRWSRCFLTPNHYTIDLYISEGNTMADLFVWTDALVFQVAAKEGFRIASGRPGFVRIPGSWSFQSEKGNDA